MSRHTRVKTSRGKARYHYGCTGTLEDSPKAYTARLTMPKGRRKSAPTERVLKTHRGYTVFSCEDSPLKPKH